MDVIFSDKIYGTSFYDKILIVILFRRVNY